jgi:hypothetical protein
MSQKRTSSLFQSSNQPLQKLPKLNFSCEIFNFYYKNIVSNDNLGSNDLLEKFPEIKTFNDILNNNPSLKRLYSLAIENIQTQSYKDAIFYTEKLATLTNNHPLIIYMLGECYFQNEDYKKVHSLFAKHKFLNYNQNFQILAAKSLVINQLKNILESY